MQGIGLDNVQCHGDEASIVDCQHEPFGSHNCDQREAAGVFCAPRAAPRATARINSRLTTTSTPRTLRRSSLKSTTRRLNFSENAVYQEMMQLDHVVRHRHKPPVCILLYTLLQLGC